jgi:hypothetical protein
MGLAKIPMIKYFRRYKKVGGRVSRSYSPGKHLEFKNPVQAEALVWNSLIIMDLVSLTVEAWGIRS